MDIKEYIASGVLELYVLDQLSPSERREVETNALQYPEVKAELDKIEETLFALASATAKTPRAGLQSTIVNKVLAADKNNGGNNSSRNSGFNWFIPLSILGILAAGIFGWLFNGEKKERENLSQEFIIAQDSCDQKDEMILRLEQMLDNIFLPSSERVLMAAPPGKSAEANIVYNVENKSVFLVTTSLPIPPAGKQYQLWGIVDGTPVDLGVFDIGNGSELISMKFAEGVEAFAVTLEAQGGSTVPTLEEMWVIGAVES